MLILTFAAIALIAALAHVAGRPAARVNDVARKLDTRGILAVVFVATFLLLWYSWSSTNPIPVVHDEMAYVLQSKIFASGHWSLPSPPLPAFWEQPHVLVEPALAAKYFPGHALVLTIGSFLGWPALMPLVLQSAAAVLLYALARRVAGGPVAFATWIIWLTSPIVLHFGPTYYSESTTVVCWLAGWTCLLEWRAQRSLPWLLGVAFSVAWCFVTRPLTGVAYGLPIMFVVMRDVHAGKHWRQLLVAVALGAAVLGIIPLWSALTTGDWRTTPLLLYTRQYMPYDVPGFGLITTPPALEISPQLGYLNQAYARWHVHHFPSTLPAISVQRLRPLSESVWGLSRGVLVVFALMGLLVLDSVTLFAVVSAAILFLLYLTFATPPGWTLYYYEAVPTLAFLTAAGLAWAVSMFGRPRPTAPSRSYSWTSPRWAMPLALGALMLSVAVVPALKRVRAEHVRSQRVMNEFDAVPRAIPEQKALLFVYYKPTHDPNVSFVRNSPAPWAERVWVVRDRGPEENARLMAMSPDRAAYLYDEEQKALFRYDPRRVR
ncbi:MAG TPA: glycosyltransferase family 39 protein [Gemmatimonadaceae bacterium]